MTHLRPLAALLAALLPAPGCLYRITIEEQHFEVTEPHDRIVVESDAGDVDITGTDTDRTRVDLTLEYHRRPPEVSWHVEQGALILRVRCVDLLGPCSADVAAEVPGALSASVSTDAGNVSARALDGEVVLDSGAGDLGLVGLSGDAIASTGAGDILASALSSAVFDAESGAGNIDAVFAEVPDAASASTGAGDVSFLVPQAAYAVYTHTGAGDVTTSGIVLDDGSAHHLSAETGAGDIRILGYTTSGTLAR